MSPSRHPPRSLRLLPLITLFGTSLALATPTSGPARAATLPLPARITLRQAAPSSSMTVTGKHGAKAPDIAAAHPTPWLAGVLQAPLVGAITLYAPPASVPVRGLALFLSGDGGWNLGVRGMAREAAKLGLWVAGFSTPRYLRALDAQPTGMCSDAAGTLATLAVDLKQRLDLPANLPVVLIGYSSGATTVYAALVQAAPGTFQGGLSLGFGPDIEARHAFCPGVGGLAEQRSPRPPHLPSMLPNTHLSAPWQILQGEIDEDVAPRFATEYTAGVPRAKAWLLPHVGHGFGVPRNWVPQYRRALESLLPASAVQRKPMPAATKPAARVAIHKPR